VSNYRIQTHKDVLKSLKKMDNNLKHRFEAAIKDLLEDPFRFKPLRYDLKGLYSARIGSFRLVYEVEGNIITIYAFEHRKRAYHL
jgi:mRNA interferase RelE/StbE